MKKMIPRLVVAAILVNASFYIAAAAVDVSNLLGYNIINLFEAIEVSDVGTNPNDMYTEIIGTVLGAGVGVAFIALIITAPATLLALAVIALILVARKALIILLIVVAPIAFVAYLLPNTESWFKKWYKMFIALLMVFPVIAAVFGASTLASEVLMSIANSTDVEGDGPDQVLYIIALGVAAIPLFTVPALLKGSLAAAGSIGAKISGYADKAQGSARNQSKKRYENSVPGQYMKYRAGEKRKRIALAQSGAYTGRNPARKFQSRVMGTLNKNRLSGNFGNRLAAAGVDLADKEWGEEVDRQQKTMKSMQPQKLMDIVKDEDASQEVRAAAAGMLMKNGAMSDIHSLIDYSQGSMGNSEAASNIRKQMMHDMNRTPFGMGSSDLAAYRRGEAAADSSGNTKASYGSMISERAKGKLSPEKWASADPDDQQRLRDDAVGGRLETKALHNLASASLSAELNDNIDVTDDAIEHGKAIRAAAAARGWAPPSPPAPTGGSAGGS